ncbi:MAG: hypothetical protein AAF619_04535 [Pseudomonadota bacterium]
MTITILDLVHLAFTRAKSDLYSDYERWISTSYKLGSALPNSLMVKRVQELGELDLVLRGIESELIHHAKEAGFKIEIYFTLSRVWVSTAYEIFRRLKGIVDGQIRQEVFEIERELKLVRVPLEKHEIAEDRKFGRTLILSPQLRHEDGNDKDMTYDPSDVKKSFIPPTTLSNRGSEIWIVPDARTGGNRMVERQGLSDRILGFGMSNVSTAKG